MERVNWFFNSDFEARLTDQDWHQVQSTPQTQEFEYFINYLEPDSQIYTTKDYDKEFLKRFLEFTNFEFRYTSKPKNISFWCQDYISIMPFRSFQSKAILLELKRRGFLTHQIDLITEPDQVIPGYLYKKLFSMGGMGHYESPQHDKKITKLLKHEKLVREEKLNRVLDFSTLFANGQAVACYQNTVDKFYQYKGTLLGTTLEIDPDHKLLAKSTQYILEQLKDYKGIFSIDSFIYKRGNQFLTQPVSEINLRKTMGYFAVKFKEKYFAMDKLGKLLLIKNKGTTLIPRDPNILLLSPLDNRFNVYYIRAQNPQELSTLLESI